MLGFLERQRVGNTAQGGAGGTGTSYSGGAGGGGALNDKRVILSSVGGDGDSNGRFCAVSLFILG